jgi:hypothetical protein
MKPLYKIPTLPLLLFIGIGAIYGGTQLMINKSGSSLGLPLSLLSYSPFSNYFIPGVVLFAANGLFSFIVCAAILVNSRYAPFYTLLQGLILTGWIVIQIVMIRQIVAFHVICGLIGLELITIGLISKPKTSAL